MVVVVVVECCGLLSASSRVGVGSPRYAFLEVRRFLSFLDYTTANERSLGYFPLSRSSSSEPWFSFHMNIKRNCQLYDGHQLRVPPNPINRITRHSMNQMRRTPGSLEVTGWYHDRPGELRTPTPLLEASKYRRQVPHLLVEGGPLFAPVFESIDPYRRFISVRQWHRQRAPSAHKRAKPTPSIGASEKIVNRPYTTP